MQSSIVILGLGKIAASFVSTFITDKVVGSHTFYYDGMDSHGLDRNSNQASPDLFTKTIQDICNATAHYEVVIVVCALDHTIESLLVPVLIKRLIDEGKTCFALVTIPLRKEENQERLGAKGLAKQLEKIMPARHLSLLDIGRFGDNIQGMTKAIYTSIVISFFESETDYILKHGALYRIFNFPEDEYLVPHNQALKPEFASVEELLKRLNELWKKRVKRSIHFDEDREESEDIVIQLKESGYKIIVEEHFVTSLLPELAPDEKRDSLLKKIRADKAKVVVEKKYEEAAGLRDKEKRLIEEMVSQYFTEVPNDYFLLLNAIGKTVLYRFCSVNGMDDFVRRISVLP